MTKLEEAVKELFGVAKDNLWLMYYIGKYWLVMGVNNENTLIELSQETYEELRRVIYE